MMADAGYGAEERARVAALLRKEGIKRNPEMQALEDVICFVFLRWYFADFAAKHPEEEIVRIVAKTARKMSPEARARALAEFDLPPAPRPWLPVELRAGAGANLPLARHCLAQVRRPERVSAEAEGCGQNRRVVIRARLPGWRVETRLPGEAGARGFVYPNREVKAAAVRVRGEGLDRNRCQGCPVPWSMPLIPSMSPPSPALRA